MRLYSRGRNLQIIIPALVGIVPDDFVRSFSALLDFCYFVRRPVIDEDGITAIDIAVNRFFRFREVIKDKGIRKDFNLPHQHSMLHYIESIKQFGAPNGLCTSITESRHIEDVKKRWRQTNKWNALKQMLKAIVRLGKLAAARVDYQERGMFEQDGERELQSLADDVDSDIDEDWHTAAQLASLPSGLAADGEDVMSGPEASGINASEDDAGDDADADEADGVEGEDDSDVGDLNALPDSTVRLASKPGSALHIRCPFERKLIVFQASTTSIGDASNWEGIPGLGVLIQRFLIDQGIGDSDPFLLSSQTLSLYNSAVAEFPYTPCEPNGRKRRERFRACRKWRGGNGRYDCVFIVTKSKPGMAGLSVARLKLIFSLKHEGVLFPCVLVRWFSTVSDSPDTVTGLYRVSPEKDHATGEPFYQVLHLNTVLRAAHLIPVYSPESRNSSAFRSLDDFDTYYVNKYIDHHIFDVLSVPHSQ